MKIKSAAASAQLRTEAAALSHQTSASELLIRDADRLTTGAVGDAANTIIGVLFPGVPVPNMWWRSELGRFCAADQSGGWRGRRIRQVDAAVILDRDSGTVAKLCNRKTLDSDADGILLGPVLDRMLRLWKDPS